VIPTHLIVLITSSQGFTNEFIALALKASARPYLLKQQLFMVVVLLQLLQ